MLDLDGSVAVVTGASRGLGLSIAAQLASQQCKVALVARNLPGLEETADRIQRNTDAEVIAVPADITVPGDRREIVERVEDRFGSIDVLANVAGIGHFTRFVDDDPRRMFAINLEAPIALSRLVLPAMVQRGRGSLLNVASLAGEVGIPYLANYSATKAGLTAFSVALREELRGTGVGVTSVSPGFMVDEGMYVPYQTPAPWYFGSNYAEVVARKSVLAMRKNRSEVIVNRLPIRPMLVLGRISERSMRAIHRTLGVTKFTRSLADKRLPYSDSPQLYEVDETAA